MIGIFNNPLILKEILGNIIRVAKYQKNNNNKNDDTKDCNIVELSSIAVKTSAKGIGSQLLQIFIDKSWQLGNKKIILTTEKDNNHNNTLLSKKWFKKQAQVRNNRVDEMRLSINYNYNTMNWNVQLFELILIPRGQSCI